MKAVEMPTLDNTIKYSFTDDRIRQMQSSIIERRLLELDEETSAQDKYFHKAKMLDVIKFFKRTGADKVSLEEFESLKAGLELYGVT